ncbi:hypothetical protein VKS41_007483 [Umbelopsis sp. WA50703]
MEKTFEPLDLSRFSPLAGNKFETRDDVVKAVHDLFEPMIKGFSHDGAVVKFDKTAAAFNFPAIHLEGFARPLWGIVPLVLGGGEFKHWNLLRRGLANGCDPEHPQYWGDAGNKIQQQVEMAALGFALSLVPEHFWEPLSDRAKKQVGEFLVRGRNMEFSGNNWMFFRILVDMGLETVGIEFDKKQHDEYLDNLDNLYINDGWYRDGADKGQSRRIEYYNAFAFHFYGLLYAKRYDNDRAQRYRERARIFAKDFVHWFGEDGSAVPYGRSLTYRFACGSYWGALAYAGEEVLPWGVIKGLYLRHMRWWSDKPVSRLDEGVLSVGYCYPTTLMSEAYNSANSPYWAMKMFITLALPESHPFWAAKELPLDRPESLHAIPVAGMVASHQLNTTTLLVSGPEHPGQRHSPEKYCKFAYSSRYGFSVEVDMYEIDKCGFDNMIGFSDDGHYWHVRRNYETARIYGTSLYSIWKPYADVEVESWVIPQGAWHIRVHRITTPRALTTLEGGFSVPMADYNSDVITASKDSILIEAADDWSGIVGFSGQKPRQSVPQCNVNLMWSRTNVPQLRADIPAGSTTELACAVLAAPRDSGVKEAWAAAPVKPSQELLEEIKAKSVVIDLYN